MFITPTRRSLPLPWSYPPQDSGEISFQTNIDRRFISDGTCGLRSDLHRMGVAVRAAKADLDLAREFNVPIPIKSFENQTCTSKTVHETLLFQEYYRPPNYLILNQNDIAWGFGALFDCLCIKFCYDRGIAKPRSIKPAATIESTISHILKNLKSIDVLVIPYDGEHNFEKIISAVKKTNPDFPVLIMQYTRDNENDNRIVEELRKKGLHAFSGEEALDMQEFTSKIIMHALGKAGIEKLKINPMYINS
jgi:hypothetical protein